MKKFISTLTSLAMSASLTAGALAVPFSANALTYNDTKKSLKIEAEKTTISAADIAAGDVTVKCYVYFDDADGKNDTNCIQAMMTFGDCASDGIKMSGITNLFASSGTYTKADGTEITCTSGPFYVGEIVKRTGKFKAEGDYQSEHVSDDVVAISWSRATMNGVYLGEKASDVPVAEFEVTIPKGSAAGDYEIEFINEDMKFVNPEYEGTNNATTVVSVDGWLTYDAKYFGGLELTGTKITVEGNGATTTAPAATTTKPAATTTTPSSTPSTDKLQWSLSNVNASEAVDGVIYVDATVTNAWGSDPDTEGIRGLVAGITYDKTAFELVEIGESDYGSVTANLAEALVSATLASDKDDAGIILPEGGSVTYFGFAPKAGIADGTYAIKWDKSATQAILDPGSFGGTNDRPVKYADLDLVDGAIIVGGGATTTPAATTTTPATTTTTTPSISTTRPVASTAPVTTTTPAPTTQPIGDVLYGDTNCDGKVNIADVVMLNKYLTNAEKYPVTDNGKKNADCDTKAGLTTNDSYCIIRSIVKLVTLPCAD